MACKRRQHVVSASCRKFAFALRRNVVTRCNRRSVMPTVTSRGKRRCVFSINISNFIERDTGYRSYTARSRCRRRYRVTLSDVPSDYLHPTDSTADVASPHVGLVTNSNTAVGVKMFFFSSSCNSLCSYGCFRAVHSLTACQLPILHTF